MPHSSTLRIREGLPHPRGATWDGAGVNFSLFSAHATKVELCLFDADGSAGLERIEWFCQHSRHGSAGPDWVEMREPKGVGIDAVHGMRLGRRFGAAGAHCPGLPPIPLPAAAVKLPRAGPTPRRVIAQAGARLAEAIERIRWRLWHGQVRRSRDLIAETVVTVDAAADD
jgi:hypothetical protein